MSPGQRESLIHARYIHKVLPKSIHVAVGMVLADNFKRKLQAIILDAPYKYYGICLKLWPATFIQNYYTL